MFADLQGLKKWPQGSYFRKYALWWYIYKHIFIKWLYKCPRKEQGS